MTIQKIKAGRVNGIDADSFVGDRGQLFYNEGIGDLRVSDGETLGGIPLSFGSGGGSYILPTASTTTKGGVKVDGTTITVASQVISIGEVPYSKLTGTPTIPTSTSDLTNGANFITASSLTWTNISGKPTFATVATSGSYEDLSNKPTIPTNTNQLTNGAGYITSSALSNYATESYVTTQGYITSSALSGYALTSAIPTDINQLTDVSGLLGQGGSSGGTTYITNNVENPYSFSIAGDDSTLREIANGESIKISGSGGIAVTTDAEGNVTITGTTVDLTGYATESYVTSQGYITSSALTGLATESYVTSRGYITELSWNDLSDKPNLAGTYSWSIAADDSTLHEISTGNSIKLIGAGGITTSSDANGNITISGIPVDFTGYATESYVSSRGYITGLSWDQLTNKPNLASTYSFNIAGTDSTLHQISSDNTIQFKGTGNIDVTTDANGVITIDLPSANVITDHAPPADPKTGELWWDTVSGNLYIYHDSTWVISNSYTNITDYYQLTSIPDLTVYALRSEISQAEAYSFNIAADDSTLREITNNASIKFIGASGITTSSDADGNITITGGAQDRLTSNARSAVLNSNGTFSLPTLTAAPNSPQAGQMALADGVSWDPMSQNGGVPYMVIYTGSGWLGMGGVTMDQVYMAILELGTAGA